MFEVELTLRDRLGRDDMAGDVFLECFGIPELDVTSVYSVHVSTTIGVCHGG